MHLFWNKASNVTDRTEEMSYYTPDNPTCGSDKQVMCKSIKKKSYEMTSSNIVLSAKLHYSHIPI